MIVIEINDVKPAAYKVTEGVPDILNFDYCLVKSKDGRLFASLIKGLVCAYLPFALSGYPVCPRNYLAIGAVAFIVLAFLLNELMEQRLTTAVQERIGATTLQMSLRSIHPGFAAIPVVFLASTLSWQTILQAVGNTIEVIGITCGVPLLLFGLIKMSQETERSKTHVVFGSASAFGGVALSIALNFLVANVSDVGAFTATNYFSNAIATIYAPDVVLPSSAN